MEHERTISMTQEELNRLHVIRLVIGKRIKQGKAAKLLGLSARQVRRLVQAFKRGGAERLIHKLRGKPSNRRHPEELKRKVIELYEIKYEDFGPTLFEEQLSEREHLHVNRETLRLWLLEAKLWERQRKVNQHRKWREPKPCFGEMVQLDGSHHDWLEGRGPELVLMGYIDDATGNVFARFFDYEGTLPAFDSFYDYTSRYGLPQSIYLDRHGAYQSKDTLTPEEELEGKTRSKTQFERALEELGVHVIHALSPQAKGRVERLFRTFQDRLIKEMRLEGIKTQEEANRFLAKFLPRFNQKFRRQAKERTNLHRPIPEGLDLKRVLSIQTLHPLRNDNTIRHKGKLYQIEDPWQKGRPKEILVLDPIDGKRCFMDHGRKLHSREIPNGIKPGPNGNGRLFKLPRKPLVPAPDHPWRRFRLKPLRIAA
jgi:transposase